MGSRRAETSPAAPAAADRPRRARSPRGSGDPEPSRAARPSERSSASTSQAMRRLRSRSPIDLTQTTSTARSPRKSSRANLQSNPNETAHTISTRPSARHDDTTSNSLPRPSNLSPYKGPYRTRSRSPSKNVHWETRVLEQPPSQPPSSTRKRPRAVPDAPYIDEGEGDVERGTPKRRRQRLDTNYQPPRVEDDDDIVRSSARPRSRRRQEGASRFDQDLHEEHPAPGSRDSAESELITTRRDAPAAARGPQQTRASPRKASPRKASPRRATPHTASPHRPSPRKASSRRASPHTASPRRASPRRASPRRASPRGTSARRASSSQTTAMTRNRSGSPAVTAARQQTRATTKSIDEARQEHNDRISSFHRDPNDEYAGYDVFDTEEPMPTTRTPRPQGLDFDTTKRLFDLPFYFTTQYMLGPTERDRFHVLDPDIRIFNKYNHVRTMLRELAARYFADHGHDDSIIDGREHNTAGNATGIAVLTSFRGTGPGLKLLRQYADLVATDFRKATVPDGNSYRLPGWDEMLGQSDLRQALVVGIFSKVLKQRVWDTLLFGKDERDVTLETMQKQDVAGDGFRRTRDRAEVINRLLPPGTFPVNYHSQVIRLALQLQSILGPLTTSPSVQNKSAHVTESPIPRSRSYYSSSATWARTSHFTKDILAIVHFAAEMSIDIRRQGDVVYYFQPMFKNEEFDVQRMTCANLRPTQVAAPRVEVPRTYEDEDDDEVGGWDEEGNDAVRGEGRGEDEMDETAGGEAGGEAYTPLPIAKVRVICSLPLVAYRQGGGRLAERMLRNEQAEFRARQTPAHRDGNGQCINGGGEGGLTSMIRPGHERRNEQGRYVNKYGKSPGVEDGIRSKVLCKGIVALSWGQR